MNTNKLGKKILELHHLEIQYRADSERLRRNPNEEELQGITREYRAITREYRRYKAYYETIIEVNLRIVEFMKQ